LVNQTPIESNPYLKARGESQLRAKHAFERRAGWRYGFVFGVLLLLAGYALDAIQQFQVHSEFWWLNLALAAVTILPLAILAGGIGGYINWLLKLAVWGGFAVAAGWCAIHIPFDLSRFALQWLDPNLRAVDYVLVPKGASGSYGMLATLGAFLGIAVGMTQTFAVGWAWERSTKEFEFTLASWAMLFASLPFAIAFGLLFDGSAQQPLRAPMQTVNNIIQSGLNDPPNLETRDMEMHRALTYLVGQRWRSQLTPEYVLHLAASEPQVKGETDVDASFSNGNLLRCRITTFGEFSGGCADLKQNYANYISEFLRRGEFECQDCQAEISEQARAWQQDNARTLTAADTTRVSHGAGSSVNVRVTTADGKQLECLFWGANPVRIAACQ
jgi:hypothetical protein